MRLTVNLEPDLYGLAKSLAKAEDCSVSAAVNRLLRRSLPDLAGHGAPRATRPAKRNGFAISRGSIQVGLPRSFSSTRQFSTMSDLDGSECRRNPKLRILRPSLCAEDLTTDGTD